MPRATIKNINEAIRAKYPDLDIEFVKGKGYFYFSGDFHYEQAEIDSIYVFALHQMDLEQWTRAVFAEIDDAIARADIERAPLDRNESGRIILS